ncbi:electron transfer flavoprotein beta subunit lysine methyltransferase [Plutella xylostella]|uniref:electron transfer flavoprotein beta subunit lysine methyltransferase n=1 Tax=Plutella xylostella TaxID=51655 RepID=UPI002032786A|nr:electron transfer flavoprotein beta subunit lysine methyltransferase [Plutella xylostella]XP_011558539.3 electron transfer flavoprotein beta subunit lysine methyltransferase [Plutella xylostella]
MLKDITSLILRHTLVSRSHLTPELSLRLITRGCEAWGARAEDVPFVDPYWGFYWPGGQAVARYILDKPRFFQSRRVLDVGCGCGAQAIAAATVGAERVLANDIDVNALEATTINAELNNVSVETSEKNFIGTKCEGFDTILIGDMFYDEEFAKSLFEWLSKLTDSGKLVLIGDPGRHGLTASRISSMTRLASYTLHEDTCLENRGFTEAAVWRLEK